MNILSFLEIKRYQSFVGIRIAPTVSPQRHFHIAFLLDVSGSMNGERLDTVKRTLKLFADQMQPEDRVSIITYNAAATVICNKENRDHLRLHADHLYAEGGTNMEAGILALTSLDLASLDAVFLLTDGEVNQGISSIRGLETLARVTAFENHKIPVYTLGYGEDHNAKLLQAIAVGTRASYTFAETHEMIPSVVGSILVAMRDEVVRGLALSWEGGARCCEAGAAMGAAEYCVGSIIANKPQWVVLDGPVTALSVKPHGGDWMPIPQGEAVEDLAVLEQWYRAEAVRVFTAAEEQSPMAALAALQTLEDAITASPVADYPLLLRIRAEIAEQREHFDLLAAAPPPPPPIGTGAFGIGGGFLMRQNAGSFTSMPTIPHAPLLTRHISNTAAFATQRGGEFNSPTQRQVSGAMVNNYYSRGSGDSQSSQEDPQVAHTASGGITLP